MNAAGNLFATSHRTTTGSEAMYQFSAISGAIATATSVISTLAVEPVCLQINSTGNLLVIDIRAGAKLINLAKGIPGTVTNPTDGATCRTTVALCKADVWSATRWAR